MNLNDNVNVNVKLPRRRDDRGIGTTTMFSFEKLDSYQAAIGFLALAARLIGTLPRGYGWLSDQLRRAALSQAVNLAEGAGRVGAADQRRHYAIARGSGIECAAILSALGVLEAANPTLVAEGRTLLLRSVSLLSKMCR